MVSLSKPKPKKPQGIFINNFRSQMWGKSAEINFLRTLVKLHAKICKVVKLDPILLMRFNGKVVNSQTQSIDSLRLVMLSLPSGKISKIIPIYPENFEKINY